MPRLYRSDDIGNGTLQLFVRGKWVDVVDIGQWDANDAMVTCRHLGFPNAVSGVAIPRLYRSDDIGNGTLQLFVRGKWVDVVDIGQWDANDAMVTCRHLGFPNAVSAWTLEMHVPVTAPGTVVNCQGSELSLSECEITIKWMTYTNYTGVTCDIAWTLEMHVPVTAPGTVVNCQGSELSLSECEIAVKWMTYTNYTGVTCDIDDCKPNPCQNGGLCEEGLNNYTCHCVGSFMGRQCEELVWFGLNDIVVEGNWVFVDGEPIGYSNWHWAWPKVDVNKNCGLL
uniref:Deleted in malignant brain tumors 1 protein-like n=1 Tax=Saccoglossus kowalevskii TaxID=10224 RepID=A0ABM0MVM8_SACKO|nr:PREDICTED: deleted in malignant brain tumors 1 protein-like [Saccoglossus kowalevskii]